MTFIPLGIKIEIGALKQEKKQMVIKKRRSRARKPVSQLAKSTKISYEWKKKRKGMKTGSGSPFKLMEEVGKKRGMKSPGGFAASIGRDKYGKAKFQAMAIAGKKRAAAKRKGTTTTRSRRTATKKRYT